MSVNDFASRAESIEQTPEIFRAPLAAHLEPGANLRRIIFGPAFTTMGERTPATLLVLTDRQWLILSDSEEGNVSVARAGYEQTLLLESTHILLYGQMKIDFAESGKLHYSNVHFNTVMAELYRDALDLILDAINGTWSSASGDVRREPMVRDDWPRHFWFAVPNNLPKGRTIRAATYWPSVYGGFHREIAPAAVLAATEYELMLVAEERAWGQTWKNQKMGTVTTYVPLNRVKSARLNITDRLGFIDLELRDGEGGETLKFLFPPDHEAMIESVIAKVSEQNKANQAE